MVRETDLGDYKLYSLVEPTTVAARQTKQIQFINQAGVRFQRIYRYDLNSFTATAPGTGTAIEDSQLLLRLKNKTSEGLGLPLPAGQVSIRQGALKGDGRELFISAPSLGDVPIDGPFELAAGPSSQVQISRQVIELHQVQGEPSRTQATLTITAFNHLDKAALVEVRFPAWSRPTVVAESAPHGVKGEETVWTLTAPANGQSKLTLTLAFDGR